jgi:hypothetical protein
MGNRRHYLSIHKTTAGMVLADDLMDKLGHVLLPAGTTLTDAMLKSLILHEVHLLSILLDEVPGDALERSLERQKKIDRLEYLFRKKPDDTPTSTLQTYLQKYRTGDVS